MKTSQEFPESTLGMPKLPRSPAFEMRNGKLVVKFEQDMPAVRMGGLTFAAADAPSLVVGGKKLPVSGIV